MPHTSDEARRLDRKHIAVMEERRRLTKDLDEQEFQLRIEMDKANLAIRPEYPTPEHIVGIAKAAELVHSDGGTDSHYSGSVAPDGSVRFASSSSTISIETGAPSSRLGNSKLLWKFTRAERAAFDELLKEHKLRVLDEHNHADGFTVVVSSKKV